MLQNNPEYQPGLGLSAAVQRPQESRELTGQQGPGPVCQRTSGGWSDPIREAWAYRRTPSFQYGERDTTKDMIVHPSGSYSVRGIWSDGQVLWVIDGERKVAHAYDVRIGTALPALNIQMSDEHSSPLNTRGPAGLWGDGTYLWITDSPSDGSKVLAYYQPKPGTLVSGLTLISATSTTATIRVRLSYPDATKTVYLRHKAPFVGSWSANLSATVGQTVDFSVPVVSSLARVVVQASLDSTFSNGTEFTDLLLVRPAEQDFQLLHGNGKTRGIATNGTHMWELQENDWDVSVRAYWMSNKRLDRLRTFVVFQRIRPQGIHISGDEEVWIVCCDRSRSRPVDRSQARPPGGRSGCCVRYSYGLPSSLCSTPPGARRACRVR